MDWTLSGGAGRPSWEPVRLIDWDGERRKALDRFYADLMGIGDTPAPDQATGLNDKVLARMTDDQLAMYAILDRIYCHGTVTVDQAKATAIPLAAQRLRLTTSSERLSGTTRDSILIAVGIAWAQFTGANFPLDPCAP